MGKVVPRCSAGSLIKIVIWESVSRIHGSASGMSNPFVVVVSKCLSL
jgi:hypothetical protein